VRVVAPTQLLREAAAILEPVRSDVVVIGALAVQIALDGHEVALTPTGDIDAGTSVESVDRVVAHLEQSGLHRSELAHERTFTWVKDDVKVQLIRSFHPFPKGVAGGLPVNNLIRELDEHRWFVGFEDDPTRGYFWAARPAALVALKEAAFGRTRPTGDPVDRDFSDVVLLLDRLGEQIFGEIADAPQLRGRVLRAAETLNASHEAATAAARELVATGHDDTQRAAEATVARAVGNALREVG
jgi:hypothetical protein